MSEDPNKALGVTRRESSRGSGSPGRESGSGHKYPALSGITVLLKFAAILAALAGFIIGFNLAERPYGDPNMGVFLVSALSGSFTAVMVWAFADLLRVFMDIEVNTRQSG